jgi:hypothetical protein
MGAQTRSETVPAAMKERFTEIAALTDAFCTKHLNDEYAQTSRWLLAALARKRPSPLLSGKAVGWAAGVVHTVGRVNFLFDRTQTPHMRADELAAKFGVGKSTGANKSKEICDLLKIGVMDPDWTLPSRLEHNTMAWMVMVNGFIVDARSLPQPMQEEAFRKGLIPYVPGTKT